MNAVVGSLLLHCSVANKSEDVYATWETGRYKLTFLLKRSSGSTLEGSCNSV